MWSGIWLLKGTHHGVGGDRVHNMAWVVRGYSEGTHHGYSSRVGGERVL